MDIATLNFPSSASGLRTLPFLHPGLGCRFVLWTSLKPCTKMSTGHLKLAVSTSFAYNQLQAGCISRMTAHIETHPTDQWNADNDDDMLRLMEKFKGSYPIIRTYRNDLCSLEICGTALRPAVLTALASDRSFSAASNLIKGRRLTVLQTVVPAGCSDHSTISTKLFAPSLEVVERAKTLSLPKGFSPSELVHKFFESVQMVELSKFYIEICTPGNVRDMSALDKEEMVDSIFSLEVSDRRTLDLISKSVTLYAISCVNDSYNDMKYLKHVWSRRRWIPSNLSPIKFSTLSSEEIKTQSEHVKDAFALYKNTASSRRSGHSWWPAPISAMSSAKRYLSNVTEDWILEYMPMHKLEIDLGATDAKIVGGRKLSENITEVLLTHAQMVELANALDLYYEDRFTLSDKKFNSGALVDFRDVPKSKVTRLLEATVISGTILAVGIFAWLVTARLRRPSNLASANLPLNSIDVAIVSKSTQTSISKRKNIVLPVNEQIPAVQMESLCKMAVQKVVEAFSWDVEIESCAERGSWTKKPGSSSDDASCTSVALPVENFQYAHGAEDILIYQVVLSQDCTILGFQPLNRPAVSAWASMPFAKALHQREKLKPGFWEWPLKYKGTPVNAVALELHILMDPSSPYVLARPAA